MVDFVRYFSVWPIWIFVLTVLVNSSVPAHVALEQWTVKATLFPDFSVVLEVVTEGLGANVVDVGTVVPVVPVVEGGGDVNVCGSVLVVVGDVKGTSPMLDG
jgi:hypothetical protein